jgi:hypothetical protein
MPGRASKARGERSCTSDREGARPSKQLPWDAARRARGHAMAPVSGSSRVVEQELVDDALADEDEM